MSAPTSDTEAVKELLVELALRPARARAAASSARTPTASTSQAGAGGDVTFAIDEEAEAWVEEFLAERAPDVAFYSEDRGLVDAGRRATPETVLVIDPIDGTRPAMAGLECCCVSVAAAPLGDGNPTMGDVSRRLRRRDQDRRHVRGRARAAGVAAPTAT